MPNEFHASVDLPSVHAIHALATYNTVAAALAAGYSSADIGKVLRIGSAAPYEFHVITNVVATVATLSRVDQPLTSYHTCWRPDAPPLSPDALDDEFEDGSVNVAWTEWDQANIQTPTEAEGHLRLAQVGNGAERWSGMYKAVPGSEFTVYTKAKLRKTMSATSTGFGLFVSDDLAANPGTADFRIVENVLALGTCLPLTRTWSAYNGTASASTSMTATVWTPYMRLRVNGTSVTSEVSPDGEEWWTLATVTTAFTPAHVGLAINARDSGVTNTACFEFFRVVRGAGSSTYSSRQIGREVSLALV